MNIFQLRWALAILMTDGFRIAHIRITHQVANPEVGNPEIHRRAAAG